MILSLTVNANKRYSLHLGYETKTHSQSHWLYLIGEDLEGGTVRYADYIFRAFPSRRYLKSK